MGIAHFSLTDDLRRCVTASAAAFALALGGCVSELDPEHSQEAKAPRIVSLNPCLDAILLEVAAEEQILALSHYSRDPSSSSITADVAARFPVTGGTVEEVLALEPDLVLAGTFIAPATRQAFARLGIDVETFGSPTSIDHSYAQISYLASIAGHPAKGARFIEAIERGLEQHGNVEPITTLVWQPGQIVPGEVTLVSEMLARNGFVSHSQAQGLKQADHVSLEALLADPPELVLVAGSSRGQQHPLLRDLSGTQVETLDPQLLYCGAGTLIALQRRLDGIRAAVS